MGLRTRWVGSAARRDDRHLARAERLLARALRNRSRGNGGHGPEACAVQARSPRRRPRRRRTATSPLRWTAIHVFSSPTSHRTRRVICSTWCPCSSGADWCLHSDDEIRFIYLQADTATVISGLGLWPCDADRSSSGQRFVVNIRADPTTKASGSRRTSAASIAALGQQKDIVAFRGLRRCKQSAVPVGSLLA